MSGHTPGPWKVVKTDWGVEVQAPSAAGPGCEYTIVERVGGDNRKAPLLATPMGNARLIAAAPELLEALIDLRDNIKADPPEMWVRVDAAIAKATGDAA